MKLASRIWRWFWPGLTAAQVRAKQLEEAQTQLLMAAEQREYYAAMERMLGRRVERLRSKNV